MKTMTLKFPDDFELVVQTTPEEFEAQIRLMAALKMFEPGKLSSGKAAELAGISRIDFFDMCGRYKVPIFNYSAEEVEVELKTDLEAARQASA